MALETIVYQATGIAAANKELTNSKRIRKVECRNAPVDATHDGLYSVGAHQEDECLLASKLPVGVAIQVGCLCACSVYSRMMAPRKFSQRNDESRKFSPSKLSRYTVIIYACSSASTILENFGEASAVTSAKYRSWVRRSFGGDFGEASEVASAVSSAKLRSEFGEASEVASAVSSAKLRSALLGFRSAGYKISSSSTSILIRYKSI